MAIICLSLWPLYVYLYGHYMSIFMAIICLSLWPLYVYLYASSNLSFNNISLCQSGKPTEICQAVKLFDIDLIRRIQLCGSPNLLNMNVPDEGYSINIQCTLKYTFLLIACRSTMYPSILHKEAKIYKIELENKNSNIEPYCNILELSFYVKFISLRHELKRFYHMGRHEIRTLQQQFYISLSRVHRIYHYSIIDFC